MYFQFPLQDFLKFIFKKKIKILEILVVKENDPGLLLRQFNIIWISINRIIWQISVLVKSIENVSSYKQVRKFLHCAQTFQHFLKSLIKLSYLRK